MRTRDYIAPFLRWLALFAALFAVSGTASAETVDRSAIHALVEQTRKFWHVPGVAVGIVRGDEILYLEGHDARSLDGKGKVTPDTLFPIASCTKSFTTTAMALLVDEGKMRWDDPPRKYVPYFRLSDPLVDRDVTLLDLVTHRTGLRSHDLLWYRSPWTQEDIIRRVGRLPLDRPFRTRFQYQSTMFTVAGFAVASASGTSWDAFVQKRLLDPLGMKATYFTTTAITKVADRASPHRLDAEGHPQSTEPYPMEVPEPAGSIQSSARDLLKWLHFQLNNKTVNGKPLVSARNLEATHTPRIMLELDAVDRIEFPETNQMSYGMGWVIQDHYGHRLWQHAGAIDGFRCHFTLVPKARLGIVLLGNLHQTRMNIALSNALLERLLGLPHRDWNDVVAAAEKQDRMDAEKKERDVERKQQRGTHPSRELGGYVGEYDHPAYGSARITLEQDGLRFHWNRFHATLTHYHYDTFKLPIDMMGTPRVVFTLDERGTVACMKVLGTMGIEFRRRAAFKPAR